MTNILKIFAEELTNENTNYFILDSKGGLGTYDDQDFVSYVWSPKRYNHLNPVLSFCIEDQEELLK